MSPCVSHEDHPSSVVTLFECCSASCSFYFQFSITLTSGPWLGLPNLRIFDGSKSSIFDRRISNHRTIVGYSIIELVRSSNGSIDRISRYSIKGSIFDIRWFDGSNIWRIRKGSIFDEVRWFDIRWFDWSNISRVRKGSIFDKVRYSIFEHRISNNIRIGSNLCIIISFGDFNWE